MLYRETMDVSGPIFAVLVVACLFYIVPRRLTWRIPTQEDIERDSPLHLSMSTVKTLHRGARADAEPDAQVSTMLMRSAGRRAAVRLARRAENRRNTVFAVLVMIAVATIPFAVFSMIQWWVPVASFAVVVGWSVFSRFEARRVRAQLGVIIADTELGDDEKTMYVRLAEKQDPHRASEPVVGPTGEVQGSLWEPITVVPATYISSAPRTVRTIDLQAPTTSALPITEEWDDPQAMAV